MPGLRAWPGWTQVYTHRREAVNPLHLQLEEGFLEASGLRWMPRAGLAALPMGKRDQRLRDLLEVPGEVPLEPPDPQALLAPLRAGATPSA